MQKRNNTEIFIKQKKLTGMVSFFTKSFECYYSSLTQMLRKLSGSLLSPCACNLIGDGP